MLLAIDTSTRQAGIALYDGALGLIAEHHWLSVNRHTEQLMPNVERLCAQAGVAVYGLQAVGVATGPGSFTGLRVGMAAAKGLALAHELAVVGIPTLDCIAYPHQTQPLTVAAVLQAGRGQVYWAPYAHGPAGWGRQAPVVCSTADDLAQQVSGPMIFAGELTATDRTTLERRSAASPPRILPPALAMRRAGCLAEMAWQRLAAQDADDAESLGPIYLGQSNASGTAA